MFFAGEGLIMFFAGEGLSIFFGGESFILSMKSNIFSDNCGLVLLSLGTVLYTFIPGEDNPSEPMLAL